MLIGIKTIDGNWKACFDEANVWMIKLESNPTNIDGVMITLPIIDFANNKVPDITVRIRGGKQALIHKLMCDHVRLNQESFFIQEEF